jgi:hypothetical protein
VVTSHIEAGVPELLELVDGVLPPPAEDPHAASASAAVAAAATDKTARFLFKILISPRGSGQ